MKKLLFISVLCLAIPVSSAFADVFDTYSSAKQVTGSIIIITSDGTKQVKGANLIKNEKAGELGYAISSTDSAGNPVTNMKTFSDRLFFTDATVEVQGDLLSLSKSLVGSARFRVLIPPTAGTTTNGKEITGAANVQIIRNVKGTTAVAKMTFLPDAVFSVYSSNAVINTGVKGGFKTPLGTAVVKLPAIKKVLTHHSVGAPPFPLITSSN